MASASAATAAASAAATAQADGTPKPFNPLLLGIGIAAFIALIVAITSGGSNNGKGDLTPVSPA